MKILITGIKGTIGTPLAIALRAQGHVVWGLDLNHSVNPDIIRCDISEYRQLDTINFEDVDLVYHLAAEFGRVNGEEYYEKVWKTNVIGTRNILEIQRRHKFKLIFASSSEIYGDTNEPILYEYTPSGILVNDYAISKKVNEMQCRNFRSRYGNEIMILRFFNAYGPGEFYTNYRSVCCLFCYRALFNIPYTVYKDYHRVFMYVGDFIPTLVKAVENFKDGEVVNIGGDEYRSVEELSNIVLKCVGKDDSLVSYVNQDKHNVVNKRPSIDRAKILFSHNPKIKLEEGIAETITWMRSVYK